MRGDEGRGVEAGGRGVAMGITRRSGGGRHGVVRRGGGGMQATIAGLQLASVENRGRELGVEQ